MTHGDPTHAGPVKTMHASELRTNWTPLEVAQLFDLPFPELVFRAQCAHRKFFDPADVQISTLLSIKTGGCPEDCAYCPQSARYATAVQAEPMLSLGEVVDAARAARAAGASRFCMGAAWRSPKDQNLAAVCEMVTEVKALGLETCVTLGMLKPSQAHALAAAGLDYYNHNIDTAPDFYPDIITTRTFEDRLETLRHVRHAGVKVCCGGILGLGETRAHRVAFITTLATLSPQPESVPINALVRVAGTPLDHSEPVGVIEFVRTIAAARITMPASRVRLSAGREQMSDEAQALCLLAGANSIFYGPKLLTTSNPAHEHDRALLATLGMSSTA